MTDAPPPIDARAAAAVPHGLVGRLARHEQLNFLLTNRIPRRLATRFMGWFSRIEQPLVRDLSIALWRRFDADLDAGPVPGCDPAPGSEVAAGISSTPERGSIRSRADSFGTRRGWLTGLMRPAVVGAVAMALFVGVALGVVLNGGGDSPSSPSRQVITGQSTIGADAVMVASDGTGTLKMTNLRGPDDGQVYQAWIQRGQEIEPTESLFVPNRRGSAVASIPDVSGVTAVMVSSEPKGGSPQPTSAPVITVSMPG